ncbi:MULTISPECIES: porin [unclassified Leisingera]|uniref:porin n=1 Tax=unclassified Leisingera TaxID=2614906 RepID=UPI00057EFE06|nr:MULTISPECIES: porin [unclassified Leisingera]KIC18080.1 porin [Leisingera sp. ANG-DT]KIC27712.1 porin [Leisingera sp. ANG-M6]
MKKVLFATTALIATAGMAAAEVKVSGYGRFGLDWNEANDVVAGRSDTNITSRFRLQFDASTETDGGVTVGGRIRAQAESRDGTPGTAAWSAPQFHVAYGGLRVNVGNIWGAIDSAPGLYLNTTSVGTGIDGMGFNSLAIGNNFNWDTFTSAGAGRNGIEAIYSAGGFTGHVSYSQSNGGTVAGSAQGLERTAIMLSYSFGDYFVTGAYQSEDNGAIVTKASGATESSGDGMGFFAVGGDFGQFGATLSYGTTETADSVTLAGEAEIGAASTIVAWVNSTDIETDVVAGMDRTDGTAFGINYEYDLGGGVTFVAGYVQTAAATNENSLQAGLHFSF